MSNHFTEKDFRTELVKAMPGYSWTIHKQKFAGVITATGIRTSGFNRLSTLYVERAQSGKPWYSVKSAGHGAKSDWAGRASDSTLLRALRELQDRYLYEENRYRSLAASLAEGRKAPEASNG